MPGSDSQPDSRIHKELEEQVVGHVRRLLEDDRLRVDTRQGMRPITSYRLHLEASDDLAGLRALLADAGTPDRSLEQEFPKSASLDVALLRRKWLIFAETVGQVHLRVISPQKSLVAGEPVRPAGVAEVNRVLQAAWDPRYPSTLVIASTSGFVPEARDLAERRSDRTVILLEPNGAGGWRVHGPSETRSVVELFDPEAEAEKRKRVRDFVQAREIDLGGSGLAVDRVAAATMLPPQLVEAELKSLAKETPGWAARRLDGRLVLFRQGAALQPASSEEPAMIDRIKNLFGRKGDTEKKIAYLSERRAALGQQRDRLYEELASFESKETTLKNEFRTASGSLGKRRITSQLLQVRKDAERRQQLLTVLNQQISVVGVHLHNLELARTGTAQGLPSSDEIAEDAAKAEQVLAELQASSELAEGVGSGLGAASEEEAALLEELEADLAAERGAGTAIPTAAQPAAPSRARNDAVPNLRMSTPASNSPAPQRPQRNEPEPG
jgi:hypothetical protein